MNYNLCVVSTGKELGKAIQAAWLAVVQDTLPKTT